MEAENDADAADGSQVGKIDLSWARPEVDAWVLEATSSCEPVKLNYNTCDHEPDAHIFDATLMNCEFAKSHYVARDHEANVWTVEVTPRESGRWNYFLYHAALQAALGLRTQFETEEW